MKTLVTQCMSLREDLRSSFETIKGSLSGSLSLLEQVRKDVRPNMPATWRDSDEYTQGRGRIQLIVQEEINRKIDVQVSKLLQHASDHEEPHKHVKLTITRIEQGKGKKSRNVQDPMYIPAQMLGAFSMAKHLEKDRRGFGSVSPKEGTDVGRPTVGGQMEDYLKEEIRKYESARMRKMETFKIPTAEGLKTFTASTSIRQYLYNDTLPSSLQLFRPFQDRKTLFEFASRRRHEQEAAKMEAIQPSPDVKRLAQRYLPKSDRQREPLEIRIPEARKEAEDGKESAEDSSYSHADKFIEGEVQLEMENLGGKLTIASMVQKKLKKDVMRKSKAAG